MARSGKGSLRLANAVSAATGVSQTVTLNQTTPGAILVRAASKAQGISGDPGKGYSLYVDIYYTDGTPLGRTHDFQTGTTDWIGNCTSSRQSQSATSTSTSCCAASRAQPGSTTWR